MSGKPRYGEEVHERIRQLIRSGATQAEAQAAIGCSRYVVRVALAPEFAQAERERHRRMWPARKEAREGDERYRQYSAKFASQPANRERIKLAMQRLRAARRA